MTHPRIDRWRKRGSFLDTPDGHVFVVDEGRTEGTPILLLHGFPTSSLDFERSVDILAKTRRVVTFDFLGFGLSDKPERFGYSLMEQADVATQVVFATGLRRAHVWAHDMGTTVATELCARALRGLLPFEIASLVLMNGSVHVEMAHLTAGQRLLASPLGPLFAQLNSAFTFKAQIRRLFGHAPDSDDLDAMWALLLLDDGVSRLPRIIRYIEERRRFAARWIGALEALSVPALVAWGLRDPVAVPAIAERLAREIPGARLETWSDLGHFPQLEDPARVAATVAGFLDALG